MSASASETEAMLEAKWRLIHAIYREARFAADFECSAGNFDRPTGTHPDSTLPTHDPRWYAVHGALTGFHERLAGGIKDELATYAAVAFMAGMRAAPPETPKGGE